MLYDRDQDLIAHALYMWANHIETRDVCMSNADLIKQNKLPRALDTYQTSMVVRLRELAAKQLSE